MKGCVPASDLARYGLLFAGHGKGNHGEPVGSQAFIDASRDCSVHAYANEYQSVHHCNQVQTHGACISHGGWAGQFPMMSPDNGTVVVFFSVLENGDASDTEYQAKTITMTQPITELA